MVDVRLHWLQQSSPHPPAPPPIASPPLPPSPSPLVRRMFFGAKFHSLCNPLRNSAIQRFAPQLPTSPPSPPSAHVVLRRLLIQRGWLGLFFLVWLRLRNCWSVQRQRSPAAELVPSHLRLTHQHAASHHHYHHNRLDLPLAQMRAITRRTAGVTTAAAALSSATARLGAIAPTAAIVPRHHQHNHQHRAGRLRLLRRLQAGPRATSRSRGPTFVGRQAGAGVGGEAHRGEAASAAAAGGAAGCGLGEAAGTGVGEGGASSARACHDHSPNEGARVDMATRAFPLNEGWCMVHGHCRTAVKLDLTPFQRRTICRSSVHAAREASR
jgi:hypothetical protein